MNFRLTNFGILSMIFVTVIVLCCYPIAPYVGLAIVIPLETCAFAFRWLGISNPIVCWVLFGACIGVLVGMVMGMRRLGLPTNRPLVAKISGALVGVLLLGSTVYRLTMPPAVPPGAATASPVMTPAPTDGTGNTSATPAGGNGTQTTPAPTAPASDQ